MIEINILSKEYVPPSKIWGGGANQSTVVGYLLDIFHSWRQPPWPLVTYHPLYKTWRLATQNWTACMFGTAAALLVHTGRRGGGGENPRCISLLCGTTAVFRWTDLWSCLTPPTIPTTSFIFWYQWHWHPITLSGRQRGGNTRLIFWNPFSAKEFVLLMSWHSQTVRRWPCTVTVDRSLNSSD